jgi:hypothetical protein
LVDATAATDEVEEDDDEEEELELIGEIREE